MTDLIFFHCAAIDLISAPVRRFRVALVESIPAGLYESSPLTGQSTADSWLHLLRKANSSVNIAAFYFTLRGADLGFAAAADSQVSDAPSPAAHRVNIPESFH